MNQQILLTKAEINHLLALIEVRRRDGWYYGNENHFIIREQQIEKKLKASKL